MILRMPQNLVSGLVLDPKASPLEVEILQEQAQTMGRMGRQLEQALEALHTFNAASATGQELARRSALIDLAAAVAWAFMVQRELCGLRDWEVVIKEYRIPADVISVIGSMRKSEQSGDRKL